MKETWNTTVSLIAIVCDNCYRREDVASLAQAYDAGWLYIGHGFRLPGVFMGRCPTCACQQLENIASGAKTFESNAPAIEDELAELAKAVPDEEWKNLPADLTDNLDHYLYGTPKE